MAQRIGASLPMHEFDPRPGKMPQATEQPSRVQPLLKPVRPKAPASQEKPTHHNKEQLSGLRQERPCAVAQQGRPSTNEQRR